MGACLSVMMAAIADNYHKHFVHDKTHSKVLKPRVTLIPM